MPRLLVFSPHGYLDDSNGASVASRALMETMARRGWGAEVVSATTFAHGEPVDVPAWLAGWDGRFGPVGGDAWTAAPEGVYPTEPLHWRGTVRGVAVNLLHVGPGRTGGIDGIDGEGFDRLFRLALDRCRPDLVIGYGGSGSARAAFARARARGVATVFHLHNFQYTSGECFADADAILVPSRYAADHYRGSLGLECTVLPNLVDVDRVRVERPAPRFLTFVNPTPEKGVYPFARMADELGGLRPDIPFLVVESRGTEADLAACGPDLRARGNVGLMSRTSDPRRFWKLARVCLMPSLWRESEGLVAVEAMLNGVPVVASDRGALPETLGGAGVVLPLPGHLTPDSRHLPSVEEIGPWLGAIVRLWDDPAWWADRSDAGLRRSGRWAPDRLGPAYDRWFNGLVARGRPHVS